MKEIAPFSLIAQRPYYSIANFSLAFLSLWNQVLTHFSASCMYQPVAIFSMLCLPIPQNVQIISQYHELSSMEQTYESLE